MDRLLCPSSSLKETAPPTPRRDASQTAKNTKGPLREYWASPRNGPRKLATFERLLNRVYVSSNQIVHRLTVCAFDLDVLPRPKRMLFNFLEKPATPAAPHLDPVRVAAATVSELGKQTHGNLIFKINLVRLWLLMWD
jgi:hypothetical protein